jgi:hypothetical protein
MSDFLGQIGNFFGSSAGKGLGEIAGLGATGTGLVGNLLADRQRAAAASAAQRNMNLTPQQLAAQVASATQPLNAGLVQAVTGATNANLAEQGLSQAPGLIATATSQALAPYEQANQQTAMQLVLQRLGLPAELARTIPPNANLAPLLAMLFKGAPAPRSVAPDFGANQPTLDQLNTPGGNPTPDTTGTYDFGSLIPPQ